MILMSRPFRSPPFRLRALAAAALITVAAAINSACDDDSPTAPSEGAIVTFRVRTKPSAST